MRTSQLPTARQPDPPTRAATAAAAGTDAAGPLVLRRYRLIRRLGAGAFGTVWQAHDQRLDREVAVKILPRERIVGGRFEREAKAAARLSHPGIVATGTTALLANIRTKNGRMPAICAVSGSFVARPIVTYIHENA